MENNFRITACTISTHINHCFDKLTDSERELLEANSVKITYRKGEMICKQGSFVSQIMYLEDGLVKVFLKDGSNSLVIKIVCGKNFLGLASVAEDFNTHQYSVQAYVDSEVTQIDLDVFKLLLRKNALFAKEIIDIIAANSVQMYGRFFCLTKKQSYGRLADILLCLSERVFKKSEFNLPLSRKDLAELSGMSQETVIRILKKFSEDGLIEMSGKSIKVIDFNRMQRISETG